MIFRSLHFALRAHGPHLAPPGLLDTLSNDRSASIAMAQNEEPNVAGQASHDAETGATESGTNTTQSSHQTPSHPPNTIRTAKLIGLKKGDEERMLNRLKRNALKQCQEVLDGMLLPLSACIVR